MEKKHEMMSLEDSEQLKGRMKFFEKELVENHHIDPNLYVEYDVKRGLRDSAGKGVLTGLTEISDVTGYKLGQWQTYSCRRCIVLPGNRCAGYRKRTEGQTFWF